MNHGQVAAHYASRGWHVFPTAHGTKIPKLKADWRRIATTDHDTITQWWNPEARRPAGIGIATGPSNLVVIDCDVKTDEDGRHISGIHNLAELQADYSLLGDTFTVDTPSGGRHYYFVAGHGHDIRNSAGKLAEGIDIRANGGYVVAPPSTTPNGAYTISNQTRPRPLPAWVADLIAAPTYSPDTPERVLEIPTWRIDPYVAAALRGETERVHAARAGQRNHTLFKAAANLGNFVGAGHLSEDQAFQALTDAYTHHMANGADTQAAAAKTIRSGIARGRRTPRDITPTTTDERPRQIRPAPRSRSPAPALGRSRPPPPNRHRTTQPRTARP